MHRTTWANTHTKLIFKKRKEGRKISGHGGGGVCVCERSAHPYTRASRWLLSSSLLVLCTPKLLYLSFYYMTMLVAVVGGEEEGGEEEEE